MPRVSQSKTQKLGNYVREFGENVFSTDNSVLYCKLCLTTVNINKRYFVLQHLKSARHKKAVSESSENIASTSQAVSLSPSLPSRDQFHQDLCKAFIDADIPLWKLGNQSLKSFLNKYTERNIPDESTLRKYYVDKYYTKTMDKIRYELVNKKIWISIDETTDSLGRHFANVVVGSLENDPSKIYLLTTDTLNVTNSSTIAQLFTSSLGLLWLDGIKYNNVLLFVTDAAPYMRKAATALKVLFPNMIHITCLVHGLHRIAEEVRSLFEDVDRLIANGKKIYLKSPIRCAHFKQHAPSLNLPPQPILTRWGTWLSAAFYYASNYDLLYKIFNELNSEDASSIRIVQDLMCKTNVRNDLIFIYTYFKQIPTTISKMEERNLALTESLKLFDETIECVSKAPGEKGMAIALKCEKVKIANIGLKEIDNIRKVLEGKTEQCVENLSPCDIASFKHAPLTSVEVERSFSKLKYILSDRRLNFTCDNFRKVIVASCNNID